jgi:NarL family two-component system response regulator LiaR
MSLRVIVADDDPFARRALRDVLQAAGITVIAEAANGRDAIELADRHRPDVVVMDLVMPVVDGLTATREITRTCPGVRVVVRTSGSDTEVGLMTLRAGASGYLCKADDIASVPAALRRADAGEAIVPRTLTMRLIEELRSLPGELIEQERLPHA